MYLKIRGVLFIGLIFVCCKNKDSIEKYLVDNQNKKGFLTFDISTDILQLKQGTSKETKQIIKSIKKVNVAILNADNSKIKQKTEKQRLKSILKNPIYRSIIKVSNKKLKLTVFYKGKQTQINEFIVFLYGSNFGVGIFRVLGKDMKPDKIIKAIKNVEFDKNNEIFENLRSIF